MKKDKNKKRKFNFIKLFLAMIIIYIVGYSIYNIVMMPIRHIRVLNNNYLSDQSILKEAKLDNYPSFFLTTASGIRHNLENNPYIKNIKVERKWFCNFYLHVYEYKILFYNDASGQAILENGNAVATGENINIPHLINYVPETVYDDLISRVAKVDDNILLKISEIEYRPNDVDKNRFLLTMSDGNYVYLTLYTFSKVNSYDEILPTLENKKGIMYLDSGNYFEIID